MDAALINTAEPVVYDEFDIGATKFMKKIQNNNYVRTTRYTVWSFIPLTLLENFKRLANVYFLLMAILGFMPWSPLSPAIQLLPLVFVIAVSMLKELIEDIFRYRNDIKYNSIRFSVFRNHRFVKIKSSNIRPGDIVRMRSGVEIPADILVLSTSEPGGLCFVNEVNLNGETAVKQRKSLSCFPSTDVPSRVQGHLKIPMPSKDLTKLDGTLTTNETVVPFSIRNCVLRGTLLAHTKWMVGVVLYTGHDTRIIQNQRQAPHKTSHLEVILNRIVGAAFILNFVLIIFSTLMAMLSDAKLKFAFVERQPATFLSAMQVLTAYAVIYSYMIPISLYVTIEFVRFFQRWTFSSDLGMYYPELGYCLPNNSNLNEELGQIEHVFSDKTGTLTENKMKFVRMSARGKFYDIAADKGNVQSKVGHDWDVTNMLTCIGLCHSVIVSADGYSSESPDEEALVKTIAKLGVKFIDRIPDESMTIEINEERITYEHLATIEFDSNRKRMSVIVRDRNGDILLFTKGADTVMLDLFSQEDKEAIGNSIVSDVDSWAEQGLRTLVCGYRKLSEEEWNDLHQRLTEASMSLENRDENVKEVGATIEHDLLIVGALAIEDELQPNVAETMSYLSLMGIKLWVLTGDKHETAVSICKSTNVITPDCKCFELLTADPFECEQALERAENFSPSVLIVSPTALEYLTSTAPEMLVRFGECCKSVVCYRMSPFMKSKVVDTMQKHTNKICLAIGDGANDVNMIQTANVGVGIIGREGRQAASNADFAIPRFRHLRRLLAVHGRLSLVRLSGVIRYMFYKNIVFCLPNLWYFIFTNWSPTCIFDGWFLATYNLIWTLIPPGVYGFFEQDISFTSMMKYPIVYREARSGRYMRPLACMGEVLNGVYQSIVLFYVNIIVPSNSLLNSRGTTDGKVMCGVSLFISVVMTVNIQTMIRSEHWNVFMMLGVVISILMFFLLNLPYGSFPDLVPLMYFVPQTLFTMSIPILLVLISLIAALVPQAFFQYMKGMFSPSYTRIIREKELLEKNASVTVLNKA